MSSEKASFNRYELFGTKRAKKAALKAKTKQNSLYGVSSRIHSKVSITEIQWQRAEPILSAGGFVKAMNYIRVGIFDQFGNLMWSVAPATERAWRLRGLIITNTQHVSTLAPHSSPARESPPISPAAPQETQLPGNPLLL